MLLGRWLNGWRRSSMAIIQECCEQYWTGPGSNTPHGANCTVTYHLSRKTIQARRTRHAGHCWRSKDEIVSDVPCGPPHMANQKQDDQLEHSYSSYVMIRDVTPKTCRRQWMIGRRGERGSGISVLAARHDDDDDVKMY